MGAPSHADAAVEALYERFPYPAATTDAAALRGGRAVVHNNPLDCHALFFPDRAPRPDLSILVAGCGTQIAPALAARMPGARVVGIDISAASIACSRTLAAAAGLDNCTLVRLPLDQVGELGETFDFIHCQGVIHHLADPAAGLATLAEVLRPDGAMNLMVYARYGRAGVYMLQDLLRTLGTEPDESGVAAASCVVAQLGPNHPFCTTISRNPASLPDEELADMLLHPRDVAFDVPGVRAMLDAAGLRMHRWLLEAPYTPRGTALAGPEFAARLHGLDAWERARLMELYYGVLYKHEFVATHPGRPSAAQLFDGDRMFDAIPIRSPHLRHRVVDDEHIALSNAAQSIPLGATLGPGVGMDTLRGIDGATSVRTIAERLGQPVERIAEIVRDFVALDLVMPTTR